MTRNRARSSQKPTPQAFFVVENDRNPILHNGAACAVHTPVCLSQGDEVTFSGRSFRFYYGAPRVSLCCHINGSGRDIGVVSCALIRCALDAIGEDGTALLLPNCADIHPSRPPSMITSLTPSLFLPSLHSPGARGPGDARSGASA